MAIAHGRQDRSSSCGSALADSLQFSSINSMAYADMALENFTFQEGHFNKPLRLVPRRVPSAQLQLVGKHSEAETGGAVRRSIGKEQL
jgi:hypothetical protein